MSNELIGVTAVFSLTAFLFTLRHLLSALGVSIARRRASRMFPNKPNHLAVSNSEALRPLSVSAGVSPMSSTGSRVVAITSGKKDTAGIRSLRRIN